ncbi:MAG: ATP-binding protein [Candidatus Nanoarchaeia archaeon]
MEISLLQEWNSWWLQPGLLEELKGLDRPRYHPLINSIEIREVTVILGVRRSGKSTLMYQMIAKLLSQDVAPEQILFINLEDPKLKDYSLEEIYNCYREELNPEKQAYIFLDEIHRKENWESWIRKYYDLKTKDKFVISGSCSYLLRKEYSTLLTGRNLTFEVFPLSFDEFIKFKDTEINKKQLQKNIIVKEKKRRIANLLKKYLIEGGFPEMVFKKQAYKKKILAQYFDDIIYKDIIDRHNLTSKKVKDLALYLATNFTSLISLRSIRSALGLSYDTTKDYINFFQEAFIYYGVDHFSYSVKEQKMLPTKIYCVDSGIRNAVSFKFSKDQGRLAENVVYIELRARGEEPYYWSGDKEVDFIIKNKDNTITAINVTYGPIQEREIKGLKEFKQKFKKTKELTLITIDIEKIEEGIKYVPLWKWLLLH